MCYVRYSPILQDLLCKTPNTAGCAMSDTPNTQIPLILQDVLCQVLPMKHPQYCKMYYVSYHPRNTLSISATTHRTPPVLPDLVLAIACRKQPILEGLLYRLLHNTFISAVTSEHLQILQVCQPLPAKHPRYHRIRCMSCCLQSILNTAGSAMLCRQQNALSTAGFMSAITCRAPSIL